MSRRAARRAGGALVAALVVAFVPGTPEGVTAAAACDPAPNSPAIKVLVVGDSISQGFDGDFTWRSRFWQYERKAGVNIDFVGPYTQLMGLSTSQTTSYNYADPCFTDEAHDAVGGKAMAATLNAVPYDTMTPKRSEVAWMTAYYQPDVVLDFMGFNDLKDKADKGLGVDADTLLGTAQSFVAQAQGAKPGTPVVIATVTPSPQAAVKVDPTEYNAKLKAQAPGWSSDLGQVSVVDINADWAGISDTWDGYHPNATGEMHLAWDLADGLHAAVPAIQALTRPIPVEPLGPRATAGVSVASGSDSTVNLSLTFPVGANLLIPFERDVTAGTDWQQLSQVNLASDQTVPVSVAGLQPHVYQYRVRAGRGSVLAQDDSLGPLYSPVVTVDLRPIGAVGTPAIASSRHAVTLSWATGSTADRYLVRFRRHGTTTWTARSTTATSYPVSGLVAGLSYDYQVVPVRANIHGPESPVVTAVAKGTVNPAVPRPTVTALTGHRLRITWKRAADATRYQVLVRPAGGAWRTLAWSTGTAYTSPRLVKGRSYAVRVVGWDSYVAGRTSTSAVCRVR